ncbi:uncharacterized protein [Nicotiana sylvestris]|uniref:uncharacterized protein n=1 Tax=Nicotiana sylvestris TaxID=4096 RepID=UPI00388CCC80
MGYNISSIKSDHGIEFDNAKFDEFCAEHGISHNFSAPRTPQQIGVVERKNRTLEDMATKMLIDSEESVHVIFNKSHHSSGKDSHDKDDQDRDFSKVPEEAIDIENEKTILISQVKEVGEEYATKSPAKIEEPNPSITAPEADNRVVDIVLALLSQIEPKNIKEVLKDADWISFIGLKGTKCGWHLVPQPSDRIVIGTWWVFKNKLDEFGNKTRNKARLVIQGYNQEERLRNAVHFSLLEGRTTDVGSSVLRWISHIYGARICKPRVTFATPVTGQKAEG